MAIKFTGANLEKVETDSNGLSELSGATDWAISYFQSLPARSGLGNGANAQTFFSRLSTGGGSKGFDMFHDNRSATRLIWEIYSGGIYTLNSTSFDAFFNSGFHHWYWCKSGASQISVYVDGALIQSITATVTPTATTVRTSFGFSIYGTTYSPTHDMADFRMYKDHTMDNATMAKIIYESQGNDNITEGLISKWQMNYKETGATATAEADLGSDGNDLTTITNTPTYISAPIN